VSPFFTLLSLFHLVKPFIFITNCTTIPTNVQQESPTLNVEDICIFLEYHAPVHVWLSAISMKNIERRSKKRCLKARTAKETPFINYFTVFVMVGGEYDLLVVYFDPGSPPWRGHQHMLRQPGLGCIHWHPLLWVSVSIQWNLSPIDTAQSCTGPIGCSWLWRRVSDCIIKVFILCRRVSGVLSELGHYFRRWTFD